MVQLLGGNDFMINDYQYFNEISNLKVVIGSSLYYKYYIC